MSPIEMVRKNLSIFLGRIALDVLGTLYLTFSGSYQEFGFQQRIYHKPRKIRMASRDVRFEWVGTAFSGACIYFVCMCIYIYTMHDVYNMYIYIIKLFIHLFFYLIYLFIYLEYIYIVRIQQIEYQK